MAEVFNSSVMEVVYYSEQDADTGEPCRVIIGDGHIEVIYDFVDEVRKWTGNEIGDGHFRLEGLDFEGEATLHAFPTIKKGMWLDGFWEEEGERGMWRIRLG